MMFSCKNNISKEFLPSIASEQVSLTYPPQYLQIFIMLLNLELMKRRMPTPLTDHQWLYSSTKLHQQLLQRILKPICALLNISKYSHQKQETQNTTVFTDSIQFSTHLCNDKWNIINYELWQKD